MICAACFSSRKLATCYYIFKINNNYSVEVFKNPMYKLLWKWVLLTLSRWSWLLCKSGITWSLFVSVQISFAKQWRTFFTFASVTSEAFRPSLSPTRPKHHENSDRETLAKTSHSTRGVATSCGSWPCCIDCFASKSTRNRCRRGGPMWWHG